MAFTTYSELLAAVPDWMHRSDITSTNVDEFIDLTEAWLNRNLRTRWQQQEATATAAASLALPSDFLEMKDLEMQTNPKVQLEYVTPQYADIYDSSGTAGTPRYYTIVNNRIRLIPSPSGSWGVLMHYYKQIPALSNSNTSNWMLTSFPDVYLWGCLLHGAWFVQDDALLMKARDGFAQAVGDVQREGKRSQFGGALTMRPDVGEVTR